jgi:hypothetical protein
MGISSERPSNRSEDQMKVLKNIRSDILAPIEEVKQEIPVSSPSGEDVLMEKNKKNQMRNYVLPQRPITKPKRPPQPYVGNPRHL